jgi:hypothetical protein
VSFGDIVAIVTAAGVSLIVAALTIFFNARRGRAADRATDRRQKLPTWEDLSNRVAELEKWRDDYMLAASNAFADIEQQRPAGSKIPRLDPGDMLVLGSAVPDRWRRFPRPV